MTDFRNGNNGESSDSNFFSSEEPYRDEPINQNVSLVGNRINVRGDGFGPRHSTSDTNPNTNSRNDSSDQVKSSIQSHNYEPDESEVWRAYVAQQHFSNRGQWWTTGKLRALKRWGLTLLVGIIQAIIAMTCNKASRAMGA